MVELLVTAAVLVILMGLAVSLSRVVRAGSATTVTAEHLARLESLLREYVARSGGALPPVPPLIRTWETVGPVDPPWMRAAATRNSAAVMACFRAAGLAEGGAVGGSEAIRDAWGMPIVLMPAQHERIGMAPGNRPFFVSPGPDRAFLSVGDNLYSYESLRPSP